MKMQFGKLGVLAVAASGLIAASTPMLADAIPYPFKNTPITVSDNIIATGTSVLFFYGLSAQDTDAIDIYDVTKGTSTGLVFPNQSSVPGTSTASLATAINDVIVIEVVDSSPSEAGTYYSTVGPIVPAGAPANSEPGINHVYVTNYSGSAVDGLPPGDPNTTPIPAGLFLGAEDRSTAEGSDFDYNDDQFILTGVVNNPPSVPEPGSIALLGTGILGAAAMLRRRVMFN